MTSAKEFMETVKGQKITQVDLVEGAEDLDAGECQFEFVIESGYRFVG
jgi:hypothetical protein